MNPQQELEQQVVPPEEQNLEKDNPQKEVPVDGAEVDLLLPGDIVIEGEAHDKPGLNGSQDELEEPGLPEQPPQKAQEKIQVRKEQKLSQEVIDRFLEYTKVYYGLEATTQVLQGESIDNDLFKKQKDIVERQFEQPKELEKKGSKSPGLGKKKIKVVEFSEADKIEDAWDLFKKLISKQMSSLPQEKVFGQIKPGIPVSVAVNIHGRVFRATF